MKIINELICKKWFWLTILFLAVLSMPIQYFTSLYFSFWMKFMFTGLILILAERCERKLHPFKILLIPAISLVAIWNARIISEIIFLGKEIAHTHYTECPGTISLSLYNKMIYRLSYEGIMGETDVFYGKYNISSSKIQIVTKQNLFELEGSYIKVGTQSLKIAQTD